uniref:Large ribosomal subunit protein bL32c n=1 Tax=Corydalis hendersonii TaxID=2706574 RepID=A0AA48P8F2_9MAGN|nr:ribosomal protein L32 [Corydalis hendersonii]YP_010474158.1 ribosomal protein L32 [Corydalis hendersonii]UVH68360.1 ribosomal protein L32 [Corydalis hendersonii]UVH68371.1 ribosomal protein L32 [Corydalis hendersonii]WCR63379.1 ribosomal protein L32 [Corydalis hendersonii]WCR63386.1 ribosomal protein L32 [Corydalis hendersonii]DBA09359.1 TPA_asm: ribosomal protein L32 [Corydalis hendersonii]
MAVPKKRTSLSKKRIRKNSWKRKGYWAARKAFSLAKSLSTGNAKFCTTKNKKRTKSWKKKNLNQYDSLTGVGFSNL